jgi:polygalacturonase
MRSALLIPFSLFTALVLAAAPLPPQAGTPAPRHGPGGDPVAGEGIFDVRSFGAVGDGKTVDGAAINLAIESAAGAGGGTVRFPAGRYLSGSIRLRSNVGLYLSHGAILEAALPSAAPYDPPEPNEWFPYQDFGHSHWHNSLIWGEEIQNVSITGPGRIDGRGLSRGFENGKYGDPPPGTGNKAIALKNCHNVTLRDFAVLHGGHFAILATGVDNLTIDNLLIDTNRDGMDIDCCRNVRVTGCSVNSPWDDAICLKSSYGLGRARATENVTVANCYVTGGYVEGTLLDGTEQSAPSGYAGFTGRIKFGTESNGGFKNIVVTNCVFENCGGLAIESVDGDVIEDVAIDNITMRNVVNSPIFIRLGKRARGPDSPPAGVIRRIAISNVVVSGAHRRLGSIISGIPGRPVEQVSIRSMRVLSEGGGTALDAALRVPEKEADYPEPDMFGTIPSFGFFIRHASDVELTDVDIRTENPDLRPAFVLEDVAGAEFVHVRWSRSPSAPSFSLDSVTGFTTRLCTPAGDMHMDRVDKRQF